MTALHADEVRVASPGDAFATAGLRQPQADALLPAPSFVVRGWALGARARVLAVEIHAGDALLRVAPVRDPTPDIAARLPDVPGADRCGFLTRVHGSAVGDARELRLAAVMAGGAREPLATLALSRRPEAPRAPREARETPSLRAAVEALVLAEAGRLGLATQGLLDRPDVEALDDVALAGRTVLDVLAGPGHVARAVRARGAALVDSVHLGDGLADLARLLDLYHRTTRVFVHESLDGLDRAYDVVLLLGDSPPDAEGLPAPATATVVRG